LRPGGARGEQDQHLIRLKRSARRCRKSKDGDADNHTTKTNAHTLDALARHAPATDDLLEVADWLGANGSHHLSAIERIELAERVISRRRFLIGAGALALGSVTGCGAQA
jgi:ferric-dicitrate binding protein FerR (iron transport regulator)